MPFAYTLGAFVQAVCDHYDAWVETLILPRPDRPARQVRTLYRRDEERVWFLPLGALPDSAMLTVNVIRSYSSQLGIPSIEFGVPWDYDG